MSLSPPTGGSAVVPGLFSFAVGLLAGLGQPRRVMEDDVNFSPSRSAVSGPAVLGWIFSAVFILLVSPALGGVGAWGEWDVCAFLCGGVFVLLPFL